MDINNIGKVAKFFSAYDMRGTVDVLTPEVYYYFGYGLVSQVLEPDEAGVKVSVMHDVRETSHEFYSALCAGVVAAGGEVISLGQGSTDMLYAACSLFKTPGCMVTASHNPPEYNGCKVVKKAPIMMGLENGLERVRDYVVSELKKGKKTKYEMLGVDMAAREELDEYFINKSIEIGRVKQADGLLAQSGRKLRVAVDTANAAGGVVMQMAKDLYQNVEFVPLFWELDGTFPNHEGDPDDLTNLADLMKLVKDKKLDMGAAFDGDADRCYLVDETGEPVSNNFLVTKIASEMVSSLKPDSKLNPVVVVPLSDSRMIAEEVFISGGAVMPTRVGHTFIKATMEQYGSVYGGESSGHHYFGEFDMMDSGLITLLYSIYVLAKNDMKPSQIKDPYADQYFFSGWHKFKLTEEQNVTDINNKLLEKYSDAHVSTIEGVQISYVDWKVMVRTSNTEPVLKMSVETRSKDIDPMEKLEELKKVMGL